MSWHPNHDLVSVNRGLDWFRDAAGEVIDDGHVIAHIALEVEAWWTQEGGHLWWRKWSNGEEVVHGHWRGADGRDGDWLLRPRDAISHRFLTDLRSGRYIVRNYDAPGTASDGGAVITSEHEVRWLEEPERSDARRKVLGD